LAESSKESIGPKGFRISEHTSTIPQKTHANRLTRLVGTSVEMNRCTERSLRPYAARVLSDGQQRFPDVLRPIAQLVRETRLHDGKRPLHPL